MKRRHYPLLVLMISGSFAFGQVGINTDKPQSTLDVAGNGASAVAKDGIIAPRVTLQQLTAKTAGTYSGSQTGAIVYVTEVTAGTGPSSAQTVEIASTGYYFFDGTLWKKIGGSSASDNIYNTNGTLTGNRVVTQGANTLAFNGNAVNAFSVDGSTFSVDAANNMIGIGTTAPHALLHLDNSVANRKIVLFEQANNDHQYLGFGVNGGLLRYQVDSPGTDHGFFAANGAGASSELMRIKGSGNVGIGTSTPQKKLHVNGDAQVTGELNVGGDGATAGSAGTSGQVLTSAGPGAAPKWTTPTVTTNTNIYSTDGTLAANRTVTQGANTLAFTGTAVNAFSVDGSTFSVDAANNMIGIGTTAPHALLHLDNSVANRKIVLFEQANNDHQYLGFGVNGGLLRYQVDSPGTDHGFFAANGTGASSELMRIKGTGNVGIGTSTPHALLQLDNSVANRKIVLYEQANNDHQYFGFGINGGLLRYQVDGPGTDHVFFAANGAGASNELVRIKGNGNVGIGTASPSQRLHVIGNILASGTITPSDIRIKKDIVDNSYGLKEILALRTINYRYKDEALSKDKKVGFVAQEIKAAMPELVTTANDEMKTLGVNYAEMTVVLTKAVQQQQDMIKKQQVEIDALKAELKEIHKK